MTIAFFLIWVLFQIVKALVSEESVSVMPGSCFNISGYFRIVLTIPSHLMVEALNRIDHFCSRHTKVPELGTDESGVRFE